MALIQNVVKGDVIIERAAGKNLMTPVNKVEHNVCSKRSVHINNNACYDWGTNVRVVEGERTLGDLEWEMSGLGDLEEDLFTEEDLQNAARDSIEAWADRLIKI